jgi:acetyl-CoA carboxylase carboxyl transferase subunit alpha
VNAEERGQSEAIGRNLYEMSELRVPIICTVIGEGGSGGALAIAVGDALMMLQYSTYSVISPEGCASILWKSADKASDAAETLGITATRLKALGLVDKIISEPLGGAHRDYITTMQNVKKALTDALKTLQKKSADKMMLDCGVVWYSLGRRMSRSLCSTRLALKPLATVFRSACHSSA